MIRESVSTDSLTITAIKRDNNLIFQIDDDVEVIIKLTRFNKDIFLDSLQKLHLTILGFALKILDDTINPDINENDSLTINNLIIELVHFFNHPDTFL